MKLKGIPLVRLRSTTGPARSRLTIGFAGAQTRRFYGLLAVLLTTPAFAAVTLVHHPYLQNLSNGRVTVMWSTRENVAGTVEYSADQSFSRIAAASLRA